MPKAELRLFQGGVEVGRDISEIGGAYHIGVYPNTQSYDLVAINRSKAARHLGLALPSRASEAVNLVLKDDRFEQAPGVV